MENRIFKVPLVFQTFIFVIWVKLGDFLSVEVLGWWELSFTGCLLCI